MAEYINIAPREHVEKRITMEAKPGDAYSESTGRRETTKYTGTWADMLAQATDLIGGGGGSVQVSCELERLEGGIGELTVTVETFRQAAGGESGGGESGGSELGTEGAPCYSCSSTTVQVNILAHPRFESIGDLPRRALKAMLDGQDECSLIAVTDEEGKPAQRMIKDCIGDDEAAQLAFKLIGKGVDSYLDVQTEVTARWRGSGNEYTVGTIVASPPGGFKAESGRDFLVTGAGVEKTGKETWCSASFRMSGKGGWRKELYGEG